MVTCMQATGQYGRPGKALTKWPKTWFKGNSIFNYFPIHQSGKRACLLDKMLQHSNRTLMRFQTDFGPIVAGLGDRNEMLFCMICAWAEKLGKTHTWLWKWYSASEATIRRPEMHMLIKLTIFLPDPRRACRTAQRRTKCRSYYVCKIEDFFLKLTTHNTVLCSMCHSNQMLPMLWTNSWQLSQHQSRFVDDTQILIHTYVGAWKIPNFDGRILSLGNWVLYKRSSDSENSFLKFIINFRKNEIIVLF